MYPKVNESDYWESFDVFHSPPSLLVDENDTDITDVPSADQLSLTIIIVPLLAVLVIICMVVAGVMISRWLRSKSATSGKSAIKSVLKSMPQSWMAVEITVLYTCRDLCRINSYDRHSSIDLTLIPLHWQCLCLEKGNSTIQDRASQNLLSAK